MTDIVLPSPVEKRILEFSFIAFSQKGFKAVALDVVAKELHISKKTIYKYFQTKEVLLEKCFDFQFSQLEEKLEQINLESSGGFESFLALSKGFILFHNSFSQLLRKEISEEIPHLEERVNIFESLSFKKRLSRLLKALRAQGLVIYPSPTKEFVDSWITLLRGISRVNEEHFEFLAKSFFKGISLKGKKRKKK